MQEVSNDDLVGFTDAPSMREQQELTKLGRELLEIDGKIKQLEKQVAEYKERKLTITMDTMPKYMMAIGQDRIGLEGSEVDLVREPYYHANIQADWPEEKRQEAFLWLEENGHGDLIKSQLKIAAAKGEWDRIKALRERIMEWFKKHDMEDVQITTELGIPWNTLTAFVKEQIEKGAPIPLETLGATVGQIVKIKKRTKK